MSCNRGRAQLRHSATVDILYTCIYKRVYKFFWQAFLWKVCMADFNCHSKLHESKMFEPHHGTTYLRGSTRKYNVKNQFGKYTPQNNLITRNTEQIVYVHYLSHVIRLWYFSSSINSFFQTRMCSHPVGQDVWFLVGPFVYFHTSYVQTAKALVRLRGCAGSPETSLVAYAISTIISWAGSFSKC